MFKTLDDAWFWCLLVGGGPNALFKIAAKQYFDAWIWDLILMLGGGGQNALFKIATKQYFDAWIWHLILTLYFDAWF